MSNPLSLDSGSVVQWSLTVVSGLLAFFGVRLHNKADRLSEILGKVQEVQAAFTATVVSRKDLDEMEARADARRDRHHDQNLLRMDRIEAKVELQADTHRRLSYLEAEVQALRDWKHEKIDPYFPGEFNAMKAQLDRIENWLKAESPRRRSTD